MATPAVPQARASSRPLSLPTSASSHHARHYSASHRKLQAVGVPTSDSIPYSHSHSLDSVAEMVATAASATVSNVVGMTGTEAGLSVQNAGMEVQWYALLSSPNLSLRHPFLLTASTNSTRQTCRPSPKRTYIRPRRIMHRLALRRPRRVCDSALHQPYSPGTSRRISGARARARPARPVDATRIRVCLRRLAGSTRGG